MLQGPLGCPTPLSALLRHSHTSRTDRSGSGRSQFSGLSLLLQACRFCGRRVPRSCSPVLCSHGRPVSVDSRPGEGSRFVVRLPLERVDTLADSMAPVDGV